MFADPNDKSKKQQNQGVSVVMYCAPLPTVHMVTRGMQLIMYAIDYVRPSHQSIMVHPVHPSVLEVLLADNFFVSAPKCRDIVLEA